MSSFILDDRRTSYRQRGHKFSDYSIYKGKYFFELNISLKFSKIMFKTD